MGRSKAPKSGSVHPNGQPAPAAPANTTGQVVPKTSPEASGAGNSAPPIEPLEEEKGFWSSAFSAVASLDAHEVLDAVGMVPVIGIAADLSNAALYAYEGDLVNAGLSAAAASPIGGQAVTAAKYATKAAKAKAKQEAAEAAARKADAPPPSKPPKKDKDTEEPKEGEGKDGGYVGGKGKKMEKHKPDCFKPGPGPKKAFKNDPKKLEKEFHRQLKDQEEGINKLTVGEYLDNRKKYTDLIKEHGNKKARKILTKGSAAQQDARDKLESKMTDSVRRSQQNRGLSSREADKIAKKAVKEKMDTLAALHDPDMIAGGHDKDIKRVGNKNVNSSLGSQWKTRVAGMDRAAEEAAEKHGRDAKMNVELERCK